MHTLHDQNESPIKEWHFDWRNYELDWQISLFFKTSVMESGQETDSRTDISQTGLRFLIMGLYAKRKCTAHRFRVSMKSKEQ